MNPRVQFEPEADAEYRLAGLWYEARREHLGVEFFDAVDEAIDRMLAWPHSGISEPRMPPELPVRRIAVTRFPYHVVTSIEESKSASSRSPTTAANRAIGRRV